MGLEYGLSVRFASKPINIINLNNVSLIIKNKWIRAILTNGFFPDSNHICILSFNLKELSLKFLNI